MSFVSSPIQDLFIRIKNAYIARKEDIKWVQYSSFKIAILDILKKHRFIKSYTIVEEGKKKFIEISIKEVTDVVEDIPVIKFYSKPSRKIYVSYKELRSVAWGRGIGIISTNKWVMPTYEAKKKKLWWELIAEIY